MVRTQIQLPEAQVEALRKAASESRSSVAEIIRRSIDQYLAASKGSDGESRRKRALEVTGRFRSGRSDVAADHDRYLAEAVDSHGVS